VRQADETYERELVQEAASRQADAEYARHLAAARERPTSALSERTLDDPAIAHLAKSRRTPEAQADIAAARAPSCAHAMHQPGCPGCEADKATAIAEDQARATERAEAQRKAIEQGRDWNEVCVCGTPASPHTVSWHGAGDQGPAEVVGLEAVLSNAAIADTPAVREMGGPADPLSKPACKACECLGWEVDNGKAIILRGADAERYSAIAAAARKAQASAATARADGAALLQLFQAFCAGLASGKKG